MVWAIQNPVFFTAVDHWKTEQDGGHLAFETSKGLVFQFARYSNIPYPSQI